MARKRPMVLSSSLGSEEKQMAAEIVRKICSWFRRAHGRKPTREEIWAIWRQIAKTAENGPSA